MKFLTRACVPALALLLFSATASHAQDSQQDNKVMLTNPNVKAVSAYWTPERFKAAKPLPLPQASYGAVKAQEASMGAGPAAGSEPHAPTIRALPSAKRLFTPEPVQKRSPGVVTPNAVGTFGAHYTSSRVFPMFNGAGAPYSADRNYPYSAVGILFFSIDGVPYLCSASVIQKRIVATAGHCVHSGTSSGFYDNWVFIPAYRDGTAPLQTWNWNAVIVTGTWASGGGTVPNAADYAMIEFADQPVGGSTQSLGYVTGWLGWQTASLSDNHTSRLGYPCNLDNCIRMQVITAAAFRNVDPNNVEYGSDAEGGSSGGPLILNFQELQAGGASGSDSLPNRVVGVTSYGYSPRDPKVQGASNLDSRWTNLFYTLCARVPGNCL
ncbi:trypsin-like serine peptidase [Massilia aerilata]|uniref:Serine protease n=1 Tax=Massilia aerilata TaxID=453817 RepID=A0ABW0RZI4_9BURK